MMFCTNCGAAYVEGAKFCGNCGVSRTSGPVAPPEAPVSRPQETSRAQSLRESGSPLHPVTPAFGGTTTIVSAEAVRPTSPASAARMSPGVRRLSLVAGLAGVIYYFATLSEPYGPPAQTPGAPWRNLTINLSNYAMEAGLYFVLAWLFVRTVAWVIAGFGREKSSVLSDKT